MVESRVLVLSWVGGGVAVLISWIVGANTVNFDVGERFIH